MLRKALLAFSLVLGFHFIHSASAADSTPSAGKVWRIGYIGNSPPNTPETKRVWEAFQQELQARGYVEGKNIVFERRFLEGKPERAPEFATDLVRLHVDVIVAAGGNPTVYAAKAATSTIPIVMLSILDPVGTGLIASLAHPGGNITGVANDAQDPVPKRLELLKAALPGASRVAFIRCLKCAALDTPAVDAARMDRWNAAAQNLGITLAFVNLSGPEDLDVATSAVLRIRPDALFLSTSPTNIFLRKELADFALRERLPLVGFAREHAVAGSLLSYGINYSDLWSRGAVYVDKILRGAQPADLPVEQPTTLSLVINLKTAKALGLTIPQSLLLRADEIIQ